MKLVISILLLFSASATAAELPTQSLFLTPDNTSATVVPAPTAAPQPKQNISVDAITYFTPEHWIVWINQRRFTPASDDPQIKVIKVTGKDVTFMMRDSGTREITLAAGQRLLVSER